jgi:Holliday junction resolvase RusA-like endonuclease
MMAISLLFLVKPTPKGRPRFTRSGHTYTDAKTRAAEKELQSIMRSQYKGKPMLCPLDVEIVFYFKRGKTVKRSSPSVKPDVDNLLKLVTDSANEILWKDDSQICRLMGEKHYGPEDEIHMRIVPFSNMADDAVE